MRVEPPCAERDVDVELVVAGCDRQRARVLDSRPDQRGVVGDPRLHGLDGQVLGADQFGDLRAVVPAAQRRQDDGHMLSEDLGQFLADPLRERVVAADNHLSTQSAAP